MFPSISTCKFTVLHSKCLINTNYCSLMFYPVSTRRVTLSQCTHLIASLRSVRIVVFNEPKQTSPSYMLIILVYIAPVSSLIDSFPLICVWKVNCTLSQKKLPHPSQYLKTLYTENLLCEITEFPDDRLVIVGAQRVQRGRGLKSQNRNSSQFGLGPSLRWSGLRVTL